MWIISISLDLYGDNFSPKKFLEQVLEPIHVFDFNEPDDPNEVDPEGVFGFGCLSIKSPQIYGLQYEMTEYESWYFDFLDRNKDLLNQHGVEKVNLFMNVFHNGGQLNFEIFSRDLLKKVASYDIAIPISYHRLTTEQIVDMLKDTTISEEKMREYIEGD